MDPHAHQSYLESQILTATPQKLRLMLLDGAIVAARQTIAFREQENHEGALEAIIRCRDIVGELLAGVRQDGTDLARQVTSVYAFLFQLLTEAQLHRKSDSIQQAIEILTVEQETWRMVCEKMPNHPIPEPEWEQPTQEITATDAAKMLGSQLDEAPKSQLNIDA